MAGTSGSLSLATGKFSFMKFVYWNVLTVKLIQKDLGSAHLPTSYSEGTLSPSSNLKTRKLLNLSK
jgi:hypothetical protein